MSEGALLALIDRYPNRVAAGRRIGGATLAEGSGRLEAAGLLVTRADRYLVTARGRSALTFNRALAATVWRAGG